MNRNCYLTMLVAAAILLTCPALAGAALSPPDDAHRQAADAVLAQIWKADPGQPKFDAIDAVVAEYKTSDEATRNAIVYVCLRVHEGYEPRRAGPLAVLLRDQPRRLRTGRAGSDRHLVPRPGRGDARGGGGGPGRDVLHQLRGA